MWTSRPSHGQSCVKIIVNFLQQPNQLYKIYWIVPYKSKNSIRRVIYVYTYTEE